MKKQNEFQIIMDRLFKGRIYEVTKKNGFCIGLDEIENLKQFRRHANKAGWKTRLVDYMGRNILELKHKGY